MTRQLEISRDMADMLDDALFEYVKNHGHSDLVDQVTNQLWEIWGMTKWDEREQPLVIKQLIHLATEN